MRRMALLGFCVAALVGAASVSSWTAPAARAKDKAGDQNPAERDFLAQFGSEDAAERTKAVDALKTMPEPQRLELIATKVIPKERRADVLSHAVDVLSRIKDEAVCEKLVGLARMGPADQRCLYIEAMANMSASTAVHRALLDLVKDREPWVRAMAAYSLGEHQAIDALDPLLACLSDKMWQVQSAAMSGLPRLRDKELLKSKAVPLLVDFLEDSSGRMREDCIDALKRICGRNLGRDVAAWRRWIAGGDAAVPPPGPDGKPAAPAAPGGPAAGGDAYGNQPPDKPHFYGIDVVSTRVVLVLDVSMSMNEPLDIDRDRLRRETSRRKEAVTGADAPKPGEKVDDADVGYDIPWWRIKTKFDFAKYQTINLISRLQPDQNFELILFSTKVDPWMGRLVPANQANKQKAIQLLEAIKFDDKTNTWGALAAAFEMSASNVKSGGAGTPDEIYLVTDGQPSWGDITDLNQLQEAVVQLAKVHQMRVNVIGIGVNLTALRKMAVATGGVCKFF